MLTFRRISIGLWLCVLSFLAPSLLVAEGDVPADYTIRAGDLLSVYIDGYPEYSRELPVLPNGVLSYPRVGDIQAAGMTPGELAEQISGRLASLNHPTVYVAVLTVQQHEIFVQGMVRKPGGYPFDGETIYLLQALAFAGGVDVEKADMNHARLFRDGALQATIDIEGLFSGRIENDIELQPRDILLIPSRLQQRTISVTGSVMNPNSFPIEEKRVHALRALWMAGGPLQDLSDLARAVIIHPDGQITRVDLKRLSQEPASQSELWMLSPGDVLYVPNAYADEPISVIGEVKAPGQYPVKGAVDIVDALSLAGGLVQDRANLKKTFIQRADGTREPVDLRDFFEAGATTSGIFLNPGDTLSIPTRMRINWNALYTVVLTASLIYNIATR